MELQEAVLGRRSIRHFLPEPVSEEMIKEIIEKSLWSPSWGNTQPWEIVVGAGASLAEFKKKNRAAFLNGEASTTDIPMPQVWPDHNKLRYKGLGTCILAAVVTYPEIVREVFSIPETKRLVMGAALGWPDTDAPVNSFERNRGQLEEFVRWIG